MKDQVRERGAAVTVVEAYRTVRPDPEGPAREGLDALVNGEADLVTFTSSSTARNLAALLGERGGSGEGDAAARRRVPAASIGPVTTRTARELGFEVVAEASPHTVAALVEAIEKHFAGRGAPGEGSE